MFVRCILTSHTILRDKNNENFRTKTLKIRLQHDLQALATLIEINKNLRAVFPSQYIGAR